MYRLYKTNLNVPQYHVETLTTKKVRDLAASGKINIDDFTNRLYNGKTKMTEIFSVSNMIANFQRFGLVPVQHPDLGTSMKYGFDGMVQTNDNNSARNKKNVESSETSSNTKRSQLMEKLNNLRHNIKTLPAAAAVDHIEATQRMEYIGGEEVSVNVLPDGIVEGIKNIYIGTSDVYTPVNYYETYDYFEAVNENRKAYLRAIQRIGDMLIAGELEGDKEAWQQHIDKSDNEYRAWKKKCNKSNAIFKKTGNIMGYNDAKTRHSTTQNGFTAFVLTSKRSISKIANQI